MVYKFGEFQIAGSCSEDVRTLQTPPSRAMQHNDLTAVALVNSSKQAAQAPLHAVLAGHYHPNAKQQFHTLLVSAKPKLDFPLLPADSSA